MSTWRQSLLAGRRFSSTAAALSLRPPWIGKMFLLFKLSNGLKILDQENSCSDSYRQKRVANLDGQVVPVGDAGGCVPAKKVVPVTEE